MLWWVPLAGRSAASDKIVCARCSALLQLSSFIIQAGVSELLCFRPEVLDLTFLHSHDQRSPFFTSFSWNSSAIFFASTIKRGLTYSDGQLPESLPLKDVNPDIIPDFHFQMSITIKSHGKYETLLMIIIWRKGEAQWAVCLCVTKRIPSDPQFEAEGLFFGVVDSGWWRLLWLTNTWIIKMTQEGTL